MKRRKETRVPPATEPPSRVAETHLSARQLDRLIEAVDKEIRKYERCRTLLHRVDAGVLEAGKGSFDAEAGFTIWHCGPARALGGQIPLLAMRTAAGRRKVVGVLRALEHGVYL
jgi:uncharacterized protein (DUF2384 family)